MGRAARSHESDAPPSDPAMTSREAARMLGVSITTAQMWMETGMLASWKTPGGHRRTRLSSVMGLLGHNGAKQSGPATVQPAAVAQTPEAASTDEARQAPLMAQAKTGTQAEARFHRLTWLASELLEVPIALVTFQTAELQIFHAAHGLNIAATPRSWAFCNYADMDEDVFTVADASKDARFANNPMVTSAPFIRFYAAVPLMYQGKAFGSLCIIDTEARLLRSQERRALQELAALATDMMALQIMELQQH